MFSHYAQNTQQFQFQILDTIKEMEHALLISPSLESSGVAAVKLIRSFLGCTRVSITTVDYERKMVEIIAIDEDQSCSIESGTQISFESFEIIPLLEKGVPFYTEDLSKDSNLSATRNKLLQAGIHSLLHFPLIVDKKLIGSLNCGDSKPNSFSQDTISIALNIVTPLAFMFQQAKLRFTIEQQSKRLKIVREIEHAILYSQSIETMSTVVLNLVRSALHCDHACIALFDHKKHTVEVLNSVMHSEPFDLIAQGMNTFFHPITTQLSKGKSIIVNEIQFALEQNNWLQFFLDAGYHSIIMVPLIIDDTLIGSLLCCDSKINTFTEHTIEIVMEIAVSLSLSLHQKKIQQLQHKTEVDLAAEKEQLHVTLRSIADGVITTDIEGKIVLMNWVAEHLTGWTLNEARGKYFSDIVLLQDENSTKPILYPLQQLHSTTPNPRTSVNLVLVDKDKNRHFVEHSFAPIKNNLNTVIGAVVVLHDITEKRAAQQSMSTAERLESLGILAGGIAHDFNNLLTGLFGYIESAIEKSEQGNPIKESLQKALHIFDRAKALTHQLLTFSKGGIPLKRTTALGEKIKEWVQFVLSGSTINIQFDIQPELWLCDVDENQIAQAIDNIVINARQAMVQSGTIYISCSNKSSSDKLPVQLLQQRYICISIRDEGIGIPPEHLNRIFDPFFTTKLQGSGLGLATAYSIVAMHGGAIQVTSETGKGTTFDIFLPASLSASPAYIKNTKPLSHQGNGYVLILDDEEYIQRVTDTILHSMGYSVICASTGEQAIDLFKNYSLKECRFIVGILDLTIPGGMGGKEVVTELKLLDPQIKVIASSGYSNDDVMAFPKKYGFDGILVKPYRKVDVQEALNSVLK